VLSDGADDLLARIVGVLATDEEYPLDGTLLHAELADGMIGPSIFKDRGADVLYRWESLRALCDVLQDLWYTQDPQQRWAEIELFVRDGSFHVTYTYPEEIDPEEDPLDRRERIVKRHFGDKPIIYPPLPDNGEPPYEV
jgi:hypothetical protein